MKRYAALIALLAMAALGLEALAQETPAPVRPGRPGVQARLGRVQDALNLTPEQEAKLEEFRKARQAENQAFGEQMKTLREQMQALRKDGKPDPAKMNPLIDQMFKLQADRAKAGLKNQMEREKIFTPEQLEKMKQGRGALGMGMRMGMRPGMGMAPGIRGRMGMAMRPGLRPEFRMGMRPGMGMAPGVRGRMGMAMRPGVRPEFRMGMRQGMRQGMRMGMGMRMGRGVRPGLMRGVPLDAPQPEAPKAKKEPIEL